MGCHRPSHSRALRLFPAHCETQLRACATPALLLIPRTLRLFPAPPAEPPTVPQRARALALCLPGVVVSVLRARQVQWPRSGAAVPKRRGGSRTDTRGTQDAGLRSRGAGEGFRKGACAAIGPRGRDRARLGKGAGGPGILPGRCTRGRDPLDPRAEALPPPAR